jgi:hypothetical protein
MLFAFLSVAGFPNFQLIAFHLTAQSVVPMAQIPLLYAAAIGDDAVVALVIGKAYDRIGLLSLLALPLLTIPIPFLGFSGLYVLAVAGVALWGAIMGIHETIMRAAIADLTPIKRRGLAYGIFNTAYGFIGGGGDRYPLRALYQLPHPLYHRDATCGPHPRSHPLQGGMGAKHEMKGVALGLCFYDQRMPPFAKKGLYLFSCPTVVLGPCPG